MDRRTFVRTVAGSATVGTAVLAGCASRNADEPPEIEEADDEVDPEPDDPDDDGTLRVVTTETIVSGEESAAMWLKEAFETTFEDAELDWVVPGEGITHYVERERRDALPDADVFFGLTPADLITVDNEIGPGALFRDLNRERLPNADHVREGLRLEDSQDRILPVSTQYVCLVYDEGAFETPGDDEQSTDTEPEVETSPDEPDDAASADDESTDEESTDGESTDGESTDEETTPERMPPETFDDLLDPAYERALLVPTPLDGERGQGFLSWLLETIGPDEYLEYWAALEQNGAGVRGTWTQVKSGYTDRTRPIIVAYAGDALEAIATGADSSRYQIAYLEGQGYADPLGAGIFEKAIEVDLAYEFLNFALSPEIQSAFPPQIHQHPAHSITDLDLPAIYTEHIGEPPQVVTMPYEQRRDELPAWLAAWEDTFA